MFIAAPFCLKKTFGGFLTLNPLMLMSAPPFMNNTVGRARELLAANWSYAF